eukprot:TRINITY_DN13870_c0_g1_i1.p1 TRINITY_DN13870_c0_g1~~TRINITY_DN13870_c0_g1_i1.p1  ORF type:complete len:304 (+),score=99.50 TRINITY_DN13870_c0_g1_i1:46-957(+)
MFSLLGIRSLKCPSKNPNESWIGKRVSNLNHFPFNSAKSSSIFSSSSSLPLLRKYSVESEANESTENKNETERERSKKWRDENGGTFKQTKDTVTRDYQPKGKTYHIKTRPSRVEFMTRHIKRLREDPALDRFPDSFLQSVTTGHHADKFFGPIHKIHKYTKKAPIRPKREAKYELYPSLLKQPKVPRNHHFFPNGKLIVRPNRITKSPKGPEYREVEFKTTPNMGKKDIETYLTQIYNLDVVRITTANVLGKKKVMRSKPWLSKQAPDWKKARVLIRSDDPSEFDNINFDFVTQPKPKQKDE